MPVPVAASGTNLPCEEANSCLNVYQDYRNLGDAVNDEEALPAMKTNEETDKNDSNRSITIINNPRPVGLIPPRRASTTLFTKMATTPDLFVDNLKQEDEVYTENLAMKKTKVHHSNDGVQSFFELDYESISSNVSDQVVSGRSEYFINGDYFNGKVRDIETPEKCYNIKFNLDSTILAIGLYNYGGVLLYETRTFTVVGEIARDDSVSALDWVDNPFDYKDGMSLKSHGNARTQLLAVSGFDGVVSIYSIMLDPSSKAVITTLYDMRMKSDVLSMIFLKDDATYYAPYPLTLAIGEKNGSVSIFMTDGETNKFQSKSKMTEIISHRSEVSAMAFGLVENGTAIATGTKHGLLQVFLMIFYEEEWKISKLVFEHLRTGAIRALRFNHDSTSLIVGGYDKTLLIVDTFLWKVVREIYVDGTVCTIEYDPFNRYLLVGTRSKILTIIDTSTLHPIKTIHTDGWVTCISWGGKSMIGMRSDKRLVSLVNLEPIRSLGLILESSRGEECSIAWSYDGRFVARSSHNEVIINDAKKEFEEVCRLVQKEPAHCIKFCYAEGKRERFAIVGNAGFLGIFNLRLSVGNVHVEPLKSVFLEPNLWAVGWSTDGEAILAGGKSGILHFINLNTYQPLRKPLKIGGRIKTIDSLSEAAYSQLGDYSLSFGVAVSFGQNSAVIIDMNTFQSRMEITRKRTVRCVRYHPIMPILAIGDGSNEVTFIDLVGEGRVLTSFAVDGRVNSIDFSPAGDFIVVASDACTFTMHDITTFKVVQEVIAKGFAMTVAFSGMSGQYLALGHAEGETDIIQLGPLLSTNYIPLGPELEELPTWAFHEAIYRSPQGPSFLQRCMLEGSKESLVSAAKVLKIAPSAVLTFDRSNGIGCFETAVKLRKPRVMQLILTTLVDGTLGTQNELSNSLLTTTMPVDGFLTLRNLVMHHPPGFATDILRSMTFVKVPFVEPIRVRSNEIKECGSPNYTNPWNEERIRFNIPEANLDLKDQEILVPAVLPLPGLGTLDFLSALIVHTGPDVFDNDAMGLVLAVMWNAGVRQYFLIDFYINVTFCVIWVFFVDHSSANTANDNNLVWAVTALAWATFVLNFIFMIEQVIRIIGRQGKRFRSTWHVIDVVSIILVFFYTFLVFVGDREDNNFFVVGNTGEGNVTLAVITTLFLTARFVSLLRGFDRTGWLVAVLMQNFLDVRGFIVVIVSILFGFTIAFRLLFANVQGQCMVELDDTNTMTNDCDEDPFGTLGKSLLSTFELTILGSYEPSMMYRASDAVLAIIVFVIAVTVVMVVALNALIAVLGDSFSRVQENVTANRRRERAELIVEYLSMMPDWQRKKIEESNQYFHALLASDGHGDLLVLKDDWQGGLNGLKREITELTISNNQMTQQAVNLLREELKDEVAIMIKNEVGVMLNEIFMEVKQISKIQRSGHSPPSKEILSAMKQIPTKFKNTPKKNFAPFDGMRKTFLRQLPTIDPTSPRNELNETSNNAVQNESQSQDNLVQNESQSQDNLVQNESQSQDNQVEGQMTNNNAAEAKESGSIEEAHKFEI